MLDLLKFTIDGHGGLDNWNRFNSVSAHLKVDGLTWTRKQQPGIISDVSVKVSTRLQDVLFTQLFGKELQSRFVTDHAGAVTITDREGHIVDVLHSARESFSGHTRESAWSQTQTFYFASYAIWTYFNAPFVFAGAGYQVEEGLPWDENGEQWRRLKVTFPDGVHTHSKIQTFYIDKNGLIRRHDYNVEISGNVASAHYVYDYIEVQGIKFPSKRLVYVRKEDNTALQPEPVLVDIVVKDLQLR